VRPLKKGVVDLLYTPVVLIKLVDEYLGKWPVFLVQERSWTGAPAHKMILPQQHFVLSKILAPVWRAIAIQSSSGLSRFPTVVTGNASDQTAVWLSCTASSRKWFQGL